MNETENIEVEVRGPLSNTGYQELKSKLEKEGVLKQKRERILIDYSTALEERTKDIRIRETNGIPEIVLKLGAWGGNDSREEITIKTEAGKFEDLVKVFGELGFKKGVFCIRNSIVYTYKGIEFALIEVPNHSYFYEAEIISTKENIQNAELEIKKVCNDLNLSIFGKEEFFKYVNVLNKEANTAFNYDNFEKGYFDNKQYL